MSLSIRSISGKKWACLKMYQVIIPGAELGGERRHRHRGAQASPPLIQPPAGYRPPDLNFLTLQCSTVLLYDLGILYTVQLYTVLDLDQATVLQLYV